LHKCFERPSRRSWTFERLCNGYEAFQSRRSTVRLGIRRIHPTCCEPIKRHCPQLRAQIVSSGDRLRVLRQGARASFCSMAITDIDQFLSSGQHKGFGSMAWQPSSGCHRECQTARHISHHSQTKGQSSTFILPLSRGGIAQPHFQLNGAQFSEVALCMQSDSASSESEPLQCPINGQIDSKGARKINLY
jgi:hypothetical protein